MAYTIDHCIHDLPAKRVRPHEKKNTKITILTSSLNIGGAEQLLLELLRSLNPDRFRISLVFLREPGPIGLETLRLGFPHVQEVLHGRFDIMGMHRLTKILQTNQPDILFLINHLNCLAHGVIAGWIAGVTRIINWQNETFKKYPLHTLTMLGRRALHTGIDTVVAAAQGHKNYLVQIEKVPREKIVVIYNGVDIDKFRSNLSADEAKIRLGIAPGTPSVGIIACLRPDKAHEVFLRAARKVTEVLPETAFIIVGDGPRREALEAYASSLGLDKNVHFLGFRRDMADVLAAMDVVSLSSNPEQETLSVAILEAMSVGIPTVSTNVGFMDEIVISGKTGFLVPVGRSDLLAEHLLPLLHDPNLRRDLGQQAAALVRRQCSLQNMTQGFDNLFSQACA